MSRFARSLLCAFALAVPALHACAASHSTPDETLDVDATIASVTLAEDCGAEARPAPGLIAGDCAEDTDCGGWCTQTAVQLSIEAGEGDTAVPFEVLSIRVRAMDGTLLDELDAREARVFFEDAFGPWDEQIEPGASLDVRYDTSAPDWGTIGGGNEWSTYGMQFRIEMQVRIDGVERTLEFAPASREAEIVT